MFMIIVIAIGLLLVAGIAYGAWFRRKIYQRVDALDKRKNAVMNEPIADEISRVKGLTISGETEQNFERWRSAWDTIVEDRFQEIELQLFDIEEAANKYQFKKANEAIDRASENLDHVESEIALIRSEVDELVSSEQQNRNEIDDVSDRLKDTRALLSRQSRALGEASATIQEHVEQCKEELEAYFEDTKAGNYMSARKRLIALTEQMEQVNKWLETIPGQLVEINVNIPSELNQIVAGMDEMEENGFDLDHFTLKEDVAELRQLLPNIKDETEKLHVDYVEEKIQVIKQQIEEMYDTLEQEVESRSIVEKQVQQLHKRYKKVNDSIVQLEQEQRRVKESYRLPEREQNVYEQVAKELQDTEKEQRVFQDLHEHRKQSFIDLKATLSRHEERIETIENDVKESMVRLEELRSDELKAYEELALLRKKIMEVQMKIQKSHLPAVPEMLISELDQSKRELEKATALLEMTPLEMKAVKDALELGQHQVGKAVMTVQATIQSAAWAERLLQFGNRYRNQYPSLLDELHAGEWEFRNGFYEEAIERLTDVFNRHVPVALSQLESAWDEEADKDEIKQYQNV
ncbi:hypothetical protein DH09_01880 [Bacillaceae bacterium JMAK1]|nr:hypothetical protein DH09_01880 [Bacillaceae bacterium JMAK1]